MSGAYEGQWLTSLLLAGLAKGLAAVFVATLGGWLYVRPEIIRPEVAGVLAVFLRFPIIDETQRYVNGHLTNELAPIRRHEFGKIGDAFGGDIRVRHVAVHAPTALAGYLLEKVRAGLIPPVGCFGIKGHGEDCALWFGY